MARGPYSGGHRRLRNSDSMGTQVGRVRPLYSSLVARIGNKDRALQQSEVAPEPRQPCAPKRHRYAGGSCIHCSKEQPI